MKNGTKHGYKNLETYVNTHPLEGERLIRYYQAYLKLSKKQKAVIDDYIRTLVNGVYGIGVSSALLLIGSMGDDAACCEPKDKRLLDEEKMRRLA